MTPISIPTAQHAPQHDFALLPQHDFALMRLPAVLEKFPVSRSAWLDGVRSGIYPAPVKIGVRAVAWRLSDIRTLIASL